ncbi:MAG: type II toxin-antitoxin system VapC family toxin [Saprospiraceae bacterium]
MTYFDSDVLVHLLFLQDPAKQAIARQHVQSAASQGQACISVLSLQEVSFVLAKLQVAKADIGKSLAQLRQLIVFQNTLTDFQRAEVLAQSIGFQNINDCVHTAIAEQNCIELATFNHSDFSRIQPLTTLKITLL